MGVFTARKRNKNCISILLSLVFITSLLCACTVGPKYVLPPPVLMPAKYKEAGKNWKIAEPQDQIPCGQWWLVFNDPELDALEAQLDAANQSIVAADATYRQARALVDEARASYYPTVTALLSYMRQGGNQSSFNSSSSSTSSPSSSSSSSATGSSTPSSSPNSFSLGLDATWELDIWGSIRHTVDASKAGAQASAALLGATTLSEQALLAQTYFQLRAVDTDQKLLDETVRDYQATLQLTRNQYASGVAALADVVQAESQLEAAQALAINNRISRTQFEHAIAVLIGKPPAFFTFAFQPLTAKPPHIPLEAPSALLERRPDVAQAERLMAQANAQIGVAVAAFFPTLTLQGSVNTANTNQISNLLSFKGLAWAVGPQLAATLLDGGLRSATVTAAWANYDATTATYRQTVLTALQNVEDNLAELRILRDEIIVQERAAANARLALKLVINQYKSGTVPYSSVLVAEIAAFTAEKTVADLRGMQMTTAVALIKALGGGWNVATIAKAGG